MPEVGGIQISLGLNAANLKASVKAAENIFGSLTKKLNSISIQGSIKGDPFSGQTKYFQAFRSSLDAVSTKLADLTPALRGEVKTIPWVTDFLGKLQRVETKLTDIARERDKLLESDLSIDQAVNEESRKGINGDTTKQFIYDTKAKNLEAEAQSRINILETQYAAAVADVKDVYTGLYREIQNAALAATKLTDIQKLKIGADAVLAETDHVKQLQVTQETLIQKIRAGNDLLRNRTSLRETLIQLAQRGVPADSAALKTLQDTNTYIQQAVIQYTRLGQVKADAESTPKSSRDVETIRMVNTEQAKLLQTLVTTKEGYNQLSPAIKKVYADSLLYKKSTADLEVELTTLLQKLQILRTIQAGTQFKNDAAGAALLKQDLAKLNLEYKTLNLELTRRNATSGAAQNDAVSKQHTLQIKTEAMELIKQSKTVTQLRAEYTRLAEIKAVVTSKTSGIQQETLLTNIYQKQSKVMQELGTKTTALTSEQRALYNSATYGVKTMQELQLAIAKLKREQAALASSDTKLQFQQQANGALLYEEKLGTIAIEIDKLRNAELRLQEVQIKRSLQVTSLSDRERAQIQKTLMIKQAEIKQNEFNTRTRSQEVQSLAAARKMRATYQEQVHELYLIDQKWMKVNKTVASNANLVTRITALHKTMQSAVAKGVKLTQLEQKQYLQLEKVLKRINMLKSKESGMMMLDRRRFIWFAQLRLYWAAYQLFAQSIQGAIDFEQKLANAGAIANATTKEFLGMREAALDVGRTTRFSAAEAAEGLTKITQAGFSAAEAITMVKDVAHLATATLSDMATASDLITTTIRAWNLEATDATMITDSFASAVSNSKLTMDGLKTSFNYITALAPQLNMSLQETLAALGQMTNRGLSASKAGTSLRAMMARILQPNARFVKALNAVGLTLNDVNPDLYSFGEILQTLKHAGFDVTRAFQGMRRRAASGAAILIDTADTYESLTKRMYEAGRAEEMAAKNLHPIQGQWKQFKDVTVAVMADAILPLTDAIVTSIKTLKLAFTAIGSIAQVLSKLIGTIFKVKQAVITTVSTLLDKFNLSASGKALVQLRKNITEVKATLLKLNEQLRKSESELQQTEQTITRLNSSFATFKKGLKSISAGQITGKQNPLRGLEDSIKILQLAVDQHLLSGSIVADLTQKVQELKLANKDVAASVYTQKNAYKELHDTVGQYIDEITGKYEAQLTALTLIEAYKKRSIEQTQEKIVLQQLREEGLLIAKVLEFRKRIQEQTLTRKDSTLFMGVNSDLVDYASSVKLLETKLNDLFKIWDTLTTAQRDNQIQILSDSFSLDVKQVKVLLADMKDLQYTTQKVDINKGLFGTTGVGKLSYQLKIRDKEINNIRETRIELDLLAKSLQATTQTELRHFKLEDVIKRVETIVNKNDVPLASILPELTKVFTNLTATATASGTKSGEGFIKTFMVALNKSNTFSAAELATIETNLTQSLTQKATANLDTFTKEVASAQSALSDTLSQMLLDVNITEKDASAKFKEASDNLVKQLGIAIAEAKKEKGNLASSYWTVLVNQIEKTLPTIKELTLKFGALKDAGYLLTELMKQLGIDAKNNFGPKKVDEWSEQVGKWLKEVNEGSLSLDELADKLGVAAGKQRTLLKLLTESFEKQDSGRHIKATTAELKVAESKLKVAEQEAKLAEKKRKGELTEIKVSKALVQLEKDKQKLLKEQIENLELSIEKRTAEITNEKEALSKLEGKKQDVARGEIFKKTKANIRDQKALAAANKSIVASEDKIIKLKEKRLTLEQQLAITIKTRLETTRINRQLAALDLETALLHNDYAKKSYMTEADTLSQLRQELEIMKQKKAKVEELITLQKISATTVGDLLYASYNKKITEGLAKVSTGTSRDPQQILKYETQRNLLNKINTDLQAENIEGLTTILKTTKATVATLAGKKGSTKEYLEALIQERFLEQLISDLMKREIKSEQELTTLFNQRLNIMLGIRNAEEKTKKDSSSIGEAWRYINKEINKLPSSLKGADDYLGELGATLNNIPGQLQKVWGTSVATWGMQSFMGKDTERTTQLKDRYKELAKAKQDALEEGDTAAVTAINAELANTNDLLGKEKTLWTQLSVGFKQFADIMIEELMRIAAQLLVIAAIKSVASIFGFKTGGVTSGELISLDSFATGGTTAGATLALLGDNPSKKELVIPSENINKNSVYGYARDKKEAESTGAVTVVNMLSQRDIVTALATPDGEMVITNAIGKDLDKQGPIYRILQARR